MKNIPLSSLSDEKERESALREAQLLSSMAHPNIVAYKESFQDLSGNCMMYLFGHQYGC